MIELTRDVAEKFSSLALAHIGREYPNKLEHVMAGAHEVQSPRALHPIFFGSYDWHSCVHGYWLLARLLRRVPELSAAPQISALFDGRITAPNVAAECAYLERPEARAFERPYGWGWLLALQAELDEHTDGAGKRAAAALRPLAQAFAARFKAFLPLCDYPIRTGVHSSTAFGLRMSADYAERSDPALFTLMRDKVLAWHGDDREAQAWEPSQDDFLSPTLITAEAMRRFLPEREFKQWFGEYLPRVIVEEPATLFAPARVSDRTDGKIAHLDGLNLSRAWCWRSIATTTGLIDPLSTIMFEAADAHINASLPHIAGDYAGEHWLATFALLALDY